MRTCTADVPHQSHLGGCLTWDADCKFGPAKPKLAVDCDSPSIIGSTQLHPYHLTSTHEQQRTEHILLTDWKVLTAALTTSRTPQLIQSPAMAARLQQGGGRPGGAGGRFAQFKLVLLGKLGLRPTTSTRTDHVQASQRSERYEREVGDGCLMY